MSYNVYKPNRQKAVPARKQTLLPFLALSGKFLSFTLFSSWHESKRGEEWVGYYKVPYVASNWTCIRFSHP